MTLPSELLFVIALISFIIAGNTRRHFFMYLGTIMFLIVIGLSLAFKPQPQAEVIAEEMATETQLIEQSAALDKAAHKIVDAIPRTKSESADAQAPGAAAARFNAAEQSWLTRAEHGKPLDSFVDHNASTAAIRIVAVDSFLSGAVQSAVQNCNDHDSALNIAMADKIIKDARAALSGHGNPHFPTPDLTRVLDDSNNCIDDS